MKKLLLAAGLSIVSLIPAFAQSTATGFTAADCAGNTHDLFAELDSGKVIVVSFVMPCATCVGPSLSAQSVVNGFASSNPGKVRFYVADDYGNTSCASVTGWCTSAGLSPSATFSTTSFVQTQYGSAAMPKVVVIGGTGHQVFSVQDNTVNSTTLQNAINSAIATTGVQQPVSSSQQLALYPNPAKDKISLSYTLASATDVVIEIYDLIGVKVKTVYVEKRAAGKQELNIDVDKLSNGIYFLKLKGNGTAGTMKFTISN